MVVNIPNLDIFLAGLLLFSLVNSLFLLTDFTPFTSLIYWHSIKLGYVTQFTGIQLATTRLGQCTLVRDYGLGFVHFLCLLTVISAFIRYVNWSTGYSTNHVLF